VNRAALDQGLAELGLEVGAAQAQALADYVALLAKWNGTYNLTAVRDPQAMITRHLLDSLSLVPLLPAGTAIDVGSGAGLPGVPLAIVQPDRAITLLDSNGKKTRFLEHLRLTLALGNIQVVHARAESYRPDAPFDLVLSRAFASLDSMLDACAHLLAPQGIFFAMKGRYPAEELGAVRNRIHLDGVDTLDVPGLEEERTLVRMRPLSYVPAGDAGAVAMRES